MKIILIMGRKSLKEDRQKEIVTAFYKVARKEGLENTSLAKIAKKLDMPPSLLVHYFKNKEELVLALIDYIIENYKAIYKPSKNTKLSSLERLRKILDNIFSRAWNRLFDDGLYYTCFALVFREEKIREKYHLLHKLLRDSLADVIKECVKEGILEIEDPEWAADFIFVISDGAYYYLSTENDKERYNEKIKVYEREAYKVLKLECPTY